MSTLRQGSLFGTGPKMCHVLLCHIHLLKKKKEDIWSLRHSHHFLPSPLSYPFPAKGSFDLYVTIIISGHVLLCCIHLLKKGYLIFMSQSSFPAAEQAQNCSQVPYTKMICIVLPLRQNGLKEVKSRLTTSLSSSSSGMVSSSSLLVVAVVASDAWLVACDSISSPCIHTYKN